MITFRCYDYIWSGFSTIPKGSQVHVYWINNQYQNVKGQDHISFNKNKCHDNLKTLKVILYLKFNKIYEYVLDTWMAALL